MTRSPLLTGALCALLLPSLACNLVDVSDTENTRGRGATVFDPYQSAASGSIRLSLQWYNGCAMLPNAQAVPKNSTPIPYPDTCPSSAHVDGFPDYVPPGELRLVANTNYFFNQFTVTDTVVNLHTNPADMREPLNWLTKQSRFKSLDWNNVAIQSEDWIFGAEVPGALQDRWTRQVLFDNANWRNVKGDTFTIEILDAEGTVRGTPIEYDRSEFLVETAQSGHSQFSWRMENVLPPRFPGDIGVNRQPEIPGWPPQGPVFRTTARMDLLGSTNPFKTFRIPDLRGEGALRVVWSQMPNEPFYFPVTFVSQQDLPPTCTDAAGNPTPCGFGIDPNLQIVAPANGEFFTGGETMNMFIDLRDGEGNRLHSPDTLPSAQEMVSNQSNGLLYMILPYLDNTLELDMIPIVNVAGPLHKLVTRSNPKEPASYFARTFNYSAILETAATPLETAAFPVKWSTRFGLQLPGQLDSGTYVALIKWSRYFAGERTTKLKPYFIQVGSNEKTTYPGRVGNCQICHRGVLSLDNLRHGLSVDHIETCKACHQYETFQGNTFMENLHKLHMRSPKYPLPKNDCTACHLVKDSATRPSLYACGTCHLTSHGEEFFAAKFVTRAEPSRYGNCAQQCHGDNTPQLHILPEN
ncbi:hypothetical protein [Hyalangium sp.]|uniref:hypothetical protein n=1 Tax=Hyalangium sp. TaxID=2028555 RepID=UPI002D5FDE3B|nr:hypothetical protein [Hyalangium sp.]HYH94947.1 hypothetical protein [Hyalangium sp.]